MSLYLFRYRRDLGIARAELSAGEEWQRCAIGYLMEFCATHRGPFMAEDAREWSEAKGLPEPPTKKSWGPAMQEARRRGIVKAIGYAPARSSNCSPKVRWAAA